MPGYKVAMGQLMQSTRKRDTMAQVKQQQRQRGAAKFQVRKAKAKISVPRFAA